MSRLWTSLIYSRRNSALFYIACGALVVTGGSFELLNGSADALYIIPMYFIFLPRRCLRPTPRFDLYLSFGIVVPVMVLLILHDIFRNTRSIKSNQFFDPALHLICQPLFIVPFWGVLMWLLARKWRRETMGS